MLLTGRTVLAQYAASVLPSGLVWYGIHARTTRSIVISVLRGRTGALSNSSVSGRNAASSDSISCWNCAWSLVYRSRRSSSESAAWLTPPRFWIVRPAALAAVATRVTLVLVRGLRPKSAPSTELPIAMVASQVDLLACACSRSSLSVAVLIFSLMASSFDAYLSRSFSTS